MRDEIHTGLKFGYVPPERLGLVWEDARALLKPAVQTAGGRFTVDDIYADARAEKILLWLVTDTDDTHVAAITTRVIHFPNKRVMAMDWIGGRRMKEWLPLVQDTIERYAQDAGCTELEGYGRPAWGRWLERYGWKPNYIAFKMELGDG